MSPQNRIYLRYISNHHRTTDPTRNRPPPCSFIYSGCWRTIGGTAAPCGKSTRPWAYRLAVLPTGLPSKGQESRRVSSHRSTHPPTHQFEQHTSAIQPVPHLCSHYGTHACTAASAPAKPQINMLTIYQTQPYLISGAKRLLAHSAYLLVLLRCGDWSHDSHIGEPHELCLQQHLSLG